MFVIRLMLVSRAVTATKGMVFHLLEWIEVVREDCQARKLNKEDAMDRCKWRKMIKEAR